MIEKVKMVGETMVGETMVYAGCVYAGFRLMYLSWKDHNREKMVIVRKVTDEKGGKKRVAARS